MLNDFKKYLAEHSMPEKSSRVLLAVSGGIDSMVMADLFLRAGYTVGLAHCNFCLRGNESDLDEELVRNFSLVKNLPFYTVRFDTSDFAEKNGVSVQMAARELRYTWFEEIRNQNGYDKIAVAHNLNDNIETMLINLIRGTGITGLSGIQSVNGRIIRPLLFATRQQIEQYSRKNSIAYREDKSNDETKYARNKIRHLVIPVLKEINPAIENTLSETICRMRETDLLVEKYISDISSKLSVADGNLARFDTDKLGNYLNDRSILFELFRPYGLSGSQTDDLSDVISGKTGGLLYTASHKILKNRKELIVSPFGENEEATYFIESIGDLTRVPAIQSAIVREITGKFIIPDDKLTACLDEREIRFPLLVRKWKKGDVFYPLGMNNRKKISDFLIDRKLSLFEKEKVMVIESDGRIAWVIGERIDSRFRIKSDTARALIIKSVS